MTNLPNDYSQRVKEFGEDYQDFETSELVKLVIATGAFLEQLTGEADAVDHAMKALYEKTSNYTTTGDEPWRFYWEGAGMDVGITKTSEYFVELNGYGYYGLALAAGLDASNADRERLYELHIAKGRTLIESIPRGWASLDEMERTLLAAEARFNLDFGRDLSVEQLAAIARMTSKSIRNLLTPSSGDTDLRSNSAGMVSAADALRWLGKRDGFRPSIWMEAEGYAEPPRVTEPGTIEEAVFVPVAKDGTVFDPVSCRNSRGYTIGPKGAEQPVSDYFEAVTLLSRAATPCWRRPNGNGNWGIVAGVSWQRRDAAEIRKMIAG